MDDFVNCRGHTLVGDLSYEPSGARNRDHLLEQYKLYVEMADRVSHRREISNRFYVALLSGLAAVLAVVFQQSRGEDTRAVIFLVAGLVGLAVCLVWFVNLRSYRQLSSGKFKIVHEMEKQLPFPMYEKEWEVLRPSIEKPKYLQLTKVEQFVPGILAIPYVILSIYSLYVAV